MTYDYEIDDLKRKVGSLEYQLTIVSARMQTLDESLGELHDELQTFRDEVNDKLDQLLDTLGRRRTPPTDTPESSESPGFGGAPQP
ncbi:MAG TPA: hypothetical protein VGJ59_09505 [Jatrophihabitantaceae bacterium]|jgi:hypothetical protein